MRTRYILTTKWHSNCWTKDVPTLAFGPRYKYMCVCKLNLWDCYHLNIRLVFAASFMFFSRLQHIWNRLWNGIQLINLQIVGSGRAQIRWRQISLKLVMQSMYAYNVNFCHVWRVNGYLNDCCLCWKTSHLVRCLSWDNCVTIFWTKRMLRVAFRTRCVIFQR
jgi:hypothetical protein